MKKISFTCHITFGNISHFETSKQKEAYEHFIKCFPFTKTIISEEVDTEGVTYYVAHLSMHDANIFRLQNLVQSVRGFALYHGMGYSENLNHPALWE